MSDSDIYTLWDLRDVLGTMFLDYGPCDNAISFANSSLFILMFAICQMPNLVQSPSYIQNIRWSHFYRRVLEDACRDGSIEYVKVLIHNMDRVCPTIKYDNTIERVFICACNNEHIEIANFLVDIFNSNYSTSIRPTEALEYACQHGNFNVIKWLFDKFHKYEDTIYIGYALMSRLCDGGHLEIAKWLTNNTRIKRCDIMSPDRCAIICVYTSHNMDLNKKREFANWLINQFNIQCDEYMNMIGHFMNLSY